MFKQRDILFFYTETPLHAGSGTGLGTVDLPIQRERHTDHPLVQASGIKGALRDLAYHLKGIPEKRRRIEEIEEGMEEASGEQRKELEKQVSEALADLTPVFGPETDEAEKHAGALAFSDARVLLFPVRSLQGVFAWITCPFVLGRFQREMEGLGREVDWDLPTVDDGKALVAESSTVEVPDDGVVLEEYHFEPDVEAVVDEIAEYLMKRAFPSDAAYSYWKERMYEEGEGIRSNLVILSDDTFRDFARFSTEILTRIRIEEETGTVATGALWSEEHLPSDTLLYSSALATDPRADHDEVEDASGVLDFLRDDILEGSSRVIQLGGDETVGRGQVRVVFLREEVEE